MAEDAGLRIVEIGDKPFIKSAFPDETTFFSTWLRAAGDDPAAGSFRVSLRTLGRLRQALRDEALSLVVCHPTALPPWHWRSLARVLFDRQALKGRLPFLRTAGPQLLRQRLPAPLAIVDQDDAPFIGRSSLFLLDRCRFWFKRELPADNWRVFMRTAHRGLPTARFRETARWAARAAKLRPLSLGLPMGRAGMLPAAPVEKTADLFFAGRVAGSSTVRAGGLAEIAALRQAGVIVDVPDGPLPPEEFYRRCAAAWLTWSPEGYGFDCFRHYEGPACFSVPVINHPAIQRHRPLIDGAHAVYYAIEPGGLTAAITGALADKARLARMAAAGRDHVLAHHTPEAIARHVVETTLGGRYRT